jgi:Na+-driven multidrug efflux pump
MRQCLFIGCSVGVILGVAIYTTSNFWLSLYLPDDPLGITYGKIRMTFVLLFNSISCAKGIYGTALQNCGYIPFTTISSIFGIFGFRMFWMWCIYPLFSNFHMLMACFLISWTLVLVCYMLGYYKLCHKKLR